MTSVVFYLADVIYVTIAIFAIEEHQMILNENFSRKLGKVVRRKINKYHM